LIEKDILVDDITKYDGAFITGTSINVLPIKSIDKTILNSQNNDLVKHIMGIYEQDMKNYINTRKEL
jgi:branched-chain amino acid aminotransferase